MTLGTLFASAFISFAPPTASVGPGAPAACEIRVDVPPQLSSARVYAKILQNVPQTYNLQISDWPTQYAEASPPGILWYKIVNAEQDWVIVYRDIDNDELTEYPVRPTGDAIEDDISGEIGALAIAACHASQDFQRSISALDSEWTTPAPSPIPPPPPSPAKRGVGLLSTSLAFGLTGLVLGVGGFAYAYDQRILADRHVHACQLAGFPLDACQGRPWTLTWRKRSMVGTGVGSAGAAMLGVGLLLAIPTALRMSPSRRAWQADPTISVWAGREGGGLGLHWRF